MPNSLSPEQLALCTPEVLRMMRDWLMDCDWGNMEPEDFEAVPDDKIIDGVERFYAGGVEQFLSTVAPVASSYTAPEPPSIGMNHTEDPFTFRDPYDNNNGSDGPHEAEDALNKDRPKGMPSKVSWFVGKRGENL